MPIKRPHKKSRYGCDQCRSRRVKCDEKLPCCSVCLHRKDVCHYSRHPDIDTESRLTAKTPSPRRNSYRSIGESVQPTTRFRELELMHCWYTRTCNSFSSRLGEIFREDISKEALRQPYLMEALLALTSLHIASGSEDVGTIHRHMSAALQYQNQALSGLREALHDVTPSTCTAIFASSAMILVSTIVSPLLSAGSNDTAKSRIVEAILPVVEVIRGLLSIINMSRQWLLQGPISVLFGSPTMLCPSLTLMHLFPAQELRQLNNALLANNTNAGSKKHEFEEATKKHQIFEDAIEKLETMYEKGGLSMLSWLAKINPGFMNELQKEEPLAVAIFMHWSAFLDQLHDMWWAKYSGRRLVKEMSATLDGRGEEWRQVTKWCRAQVGICE